MKGFDDNLDSWTYVIMWVASFIIVCGLIIAIAVWKPIIEHVIFGIAVLVSVAFICNKIIDWIVYKDNFDV